MTIPTFTVVPNTASPSTFSSDMDSWLSEIAAWTAAVNATGTAFALAVQGTSTSSVTFGTGAKTLTVQTGLGFALGMDVVIASTATPTDRMLATVTAYNSGTGVLSATAWSSVGAGTLTAWTVSMTTAVDLAQFVTPDGTQTLTNKTISGASNTISGLTVASGGTGRATLTANNVLLGNGTGAVGLVAPGTSGNVLTSNGTTWVSGAPNSTLTGSTSGTSNFVGAGAGAAIPTGVHNTFVGQSAGNAVTTGAANVFVGAYASNTKTTISYCMAMGNSAGGEDATSGEGGVFIGSAAGRFRGEDYAVNIGYFAGRNQNNATGGSVCVGAYAGDGAALADNHGITAIGFKAAYSCNVAQYMTAVGYESLYSISSGDGNTAQGYRAGYDITTGANNTIIGFNAGNSGTNDLTTGSNNTLIGYNAAATAATVSNEITLGNSSIATLRCQVTTITALSDRRDKTDIVPIAAGLDFVNRLKPVSFTWSMRDGGKVGVADTGFIAQDLKAVQQDTGIDIPGLVYEPSPERLEAGYGKLLPVLVKAIQDLSAEVAALKKGSSPC